MELDLPDYTEFPSVDAMNDHADRVAAEYPALVSVRTIGTSRLGDPIRVLTVGDGPREAVVIGGPHPNEPVGALTIQTLVELLRADSRGYRWHFVVCADPDGARLNEGWYSRPGDRRAYVEHFYRPDLADQVEWTFPPGQPLPETTALMELMDAVRPSLVYSLHNGEYQGAFFYINRDDPQLAARLTELPVAQGVPLHIGEPEQPRTKTIAPAAYLTPSGEALGAGGSSADYAAKFGALHVMAEVPYWVDPRVSDDSPSDRTYADVLAESVAGRRELVELLTTSLRSVGPDLTVMSPFRTSTERTLLMVARLAELDDIHTDRMATVSEEFGHRQDVHLFRLRLTGTFLRMLDAEFAAGNVTPRVRKQRALVGRQLDDWFREAEVDSPGAPVPIRKLVAIQVGTALVAAQWCRRER